MIILGFWTLHFYSCAKFTCFVTLCVLHNFVKWSVNSFLAKIEEIIFQWQLDLLFPCVMAYFFLVRWTHYMKKHHISMKNWGGINNTIITKHRLCSRTTSTYIYIKGFVWKFWFVAVHNHFIKYSMGMFGNFFNVKKC